MTVDYCENYDLENVVTPIQIDNFERLLNQSSYDTVKTDFLIDGLKNGFKLNYRGPREVTVRSPNLPFRTGNKIDLWNMVMKEVRLKRYAGPYPQPPFKHYIQSPIGLVPKDGGKKMRLIFHLSYPRDGKSSVNINTPKEHCTVQYKDFDQAVRRCMEELNEGEFCYLGKSDLTSAFRILGISPDDWPLLVMKAENPKDGKIYYFVDKCLPFGHSISCALFQKMSDAMEWITRHRTGKESINYLDDFFFAAVKKFLCDLQVETFLHVCEEINFPYSQEKTQWSCTQLVFLGLLINTVLRLICVPTEKIEKAKDLILILLQRKKSKAKLIEIQRLAGYLNFLCKAVLPGRPFVRRLYFMCSGLTHPHHHTKLNHGAKEDLRMWLRFLDHPSVYCHSFLDYHNVIKPEQVNFYTDTSGNATLGAGGVCQKSWYSIKWEKSFIKNYSPSIEFLELYAVLIAAINWLHRFANRRIIIFCDNISVVYMINRNTSSCKQCLNLIRKLVLHCMIHNVRLSANYVSSKQNKLADLLSRRKIQQFKALASNMEDDPTPVPDELWPMHRLWQKF